MAEKTTYLDDPAKEPALVRFAKDEVSESKKVEWPNRETTRNLTLVVIALTTVMAVVLGGLDLLLTFLYSFFRTVFGV